MNKDMLLTMFNDKEAQQGGALYGMFREGILRYLDPLYHGTIMESLTDSIYDTIMHRSVSSVGLVAIITRYSLDSLINQWVQDYADGKIYLDLSGEDSTFVHGLLQAYLDTLPVTEAYVDQTMIEIAHKLSGSHYINMAQLTMAIRAVVMTSYPKLYKDMVKHTATYDAQFECIVKGVLSKGTVKVDK